MTKSVKVYSIFSKIVVTITLWRNRGEALRRFSQKTKSFLSQQRFFCLRRVFFSKAFFAIEKKRLPLCAIFPRSVLCLQSEHHRITDEMVFLL